MLAGKLQQGGFRPAGEHSRKESAHLLQSGNLSLLNFVQWHQVSGPIVEFFPENSNIPYFHSETHQPALAFCDLELLL